MLDDSARENVRDLADEYGFRYIVRPNPGEMKKAGNLTHALGISAGDFIAVIDADFAVRPEFLYETMPYFADSEGRHRPDGPVLRRQQSVVLLHPALRGNPAGDLLPVHPAGQGPL